MTHADRAPAIEADRLSRCFGKIQAVSEVSFSLINGQTTVILGPNGAGKTTVVRLLTGLLEPDRGRALIGGHRAGSIEARRRVGAMIQDAQLPGTLKVFEVLNMLRAGYEQPMAIARVLEEFRLSEFAQRRLDQLSGGQRRRVECAAAMCGDPLTLILDEPTAHMDQESKEVFWSLIERFRQAGKTIVLVSHQWEEIEALADNVLVMNQGRLLASLSSVHMRSLVSGSKVSFSGTFDLSAFGQWSDVHSVVRKGRRIEALVSDPAKFVQRLRDLQLEHSEVSITLPSLEEAMRMLVAKANEAVQ